MPSYPDSEVSCLLVEQGLRPVLLHPLSRLLARLRDDGISRSLQWLWYHLRWRMRERMLGVDTGEQAFGVVVDDDGENHCYEAIDTRCFELILDSLSIDAGRDVFLDLGCGKGRALVLAASLPFKRVYGLELSAPLSAIATRNVHAAQKRLACQDIRVIQGSAASTPLPDDVTVLFMFNPFSGSILEQAMEQVHESLKRQPRKLRVVYVLPVDAVNHLDTLDWLARKSRIEPGYLEVDECLVYETCGTPAGDQTVAAT